MVCVAKQTAFQDCEAWLKSEVSKEFKAKSVMEVPMAIGILLWYSVVGRTIKRAFTSNNILPMGRDNFALLLHNINNL